MQSKVYLIPTVLYDDEMALRSIAGYTIEALKSCTCFYVENERTARRFLKKIYKEINIDNYEWHTIHKTENNVLNNFKNDINNKKPIGILSEAGCPGIADPGQILIHTAQQMNAKVIPLVGPSSILLALMASGMNGQCFQFVGYLPIGIYERKKNIAALENESAKKNCTQIFIETPYRNNQLLNDILLTSKGETQLCIGIDITSSNELIQTKTIKDWKNIKPDLNKRQVIFLLYAGSYH